jgi:hypothetical protein
MNRNDAKKIAQTITNEQLLEMFVQAEKNIKDWTKVSTVNKGMTKGTAWNILAKNFDVTHKYHNMAKVNMLREFGDFLHDNLKIIKPKKNPITTVHQEPELDILHNLYKDMFLL